MAKKNGTKYALLDLNMVKDTYIIKYTTESSFVSFGMLQNNNYGLCALIRIITVCMVKKYAHPAWYPDLCWYR